MNNTHFEENVYKYDYANFGSVLVAVYIISFLVCLFQCKRPKNDDLDDLDDYVEIEVDAKDLGEFLNSDESVDVTHLEIRGELPVDQPYTGTDIFHACPNLSELHIYDDNFLIYSENIHIMNGCRLETIWTSTLTVEDFQNVRLPKIKKIIIENLESDLEVSTLFYIHQTLQEVVLYYESTDVEITCRNNLTFDICVGSELIIVGNLLHAEHLELFSWIFSKSEPNSDLDCYNEELETDDVYEEEDDINKDPNYVPSEDEDEDDYVPSEDENSDEDEYEKLNKELVDKVAKLSEKTGKSVIECMADVLTEDLNNICEPCENNVRECECYEENEDWKLQAFHAMHQGSP